MFPFDSPNAARACILLKLKQTSLLSKSLWYSKIQALYTMENRIAICDHRAIFRSGLVFFPSALQLEEANGTKT